VLILPFLLIGGLFPVTQKGEAMSDKMWGRACQGFILLVGISAILGILHAKAHAQNLITCESASTGQSDWWKVKSCPAVTGQQLTEISNEFGRRMDEIGHCGEWGPWIVEKTGNIMGRYKNPQCPGNPNDGSYGIPEPPRSLYHQELRRNGAHGNFYWWNETREHEVQP
jgi:hypothetical protein